ncbi:MAG: 50S ribosomal protein L29 [Chloroflexi bacterium]|nr:MAG: 50S ribosomal protein L29 [Chloroflexota bacterium]
MKVDELRVLEADELWMRLRIENSSQISKVRHDIARIMTVLRERDFGIGPTLEEAQPSAVAVAVAEPEPEAEAVVEEAPKPKRGRKKKEDAE